MTTSSEITDRVIFRPTVDGENQHICAWSAAEWPPPDELWIASGELSGQVVFVDPGTVDPHWLAKAQESPTISFTKYRRDSASRMTEPAPADARWCRAAVYVEASDANQ